VLFFLAKKEERVGLLDWRVFGRRPPTLLGGAMAMAMDTEIESTQREIL
jgi:hypothetical protein